MLLLARHEGAAARLPKEQPGHSLRRLPLKPQVQHPSFASSHSASPSLTHNMAGFGEEALGALSAAICTCP
jgi:hypothetical protein